MNKKRRISREERLDWRALPVDEWNTLTFHAYFADQNRDLFNVADYVPLRNWRFEQALIKRAIDEHGAAILKRAFDECFRTYRPTREYPLLTAGFAIAYRINTLLPRLKAEERAVELIQAETAAGDPDYGALKSLI